MSTVSLCLTAAGLARARVLEDNQSLWLGHFLTALEVKMPLKINVYMVLGPLFTYRYSSMTIVKSVVNSSIVVILQPACFPTSERVVSVKQVGVDWGSTHCR